MSARRFVNRIKRFSRESRLKRDARRDFPMVLGEVRSAFAFIELAANLGGVPGGPKAVKSGKISL
jgi:hypothetical protein